MRWITHLGSDGERAGILVEQGARLLPIGTSLLDILNSGRSLGELGQKLERTGAFLPTSALRLGCPVNPPPSFRDFLAFKEHFENTAAGETAGHDVWRGQPVFYFSNPAAFKAPWTEIPVPPGCEMFDYELEVAVVVGAGGSNLTPIEAEHHIAGMAILCDWSARDLQSREMQVGLGPAKGKDSSTSMGPWLLSWDELAEVRSGRGFALDVRAYVNGRLYSSGRLSDLYWSFGEMLAQASQGTRLVPGDVIGSGTVGRGCILELRGLEGESAYPWLQAGDHVVLEGEGLGRLEHRIVDGVPPVWIPAARRRR